MSRRARVVRRFTRKRKWRESDHARGADGKFVKGRKAAKTKVERRKRRRRVARRAGGVALAAAASAPLIYDQVSTYRTDKVFRDYMGRNGMRVKARPGTYSDAAKLIRDITKKRRR